MTWDKEGAAALNYSRLLTRPERWTASDMQCPLSINWLGHEQPRSWILWHMIEHKIHHGGELSFTLGCMACEEWMFSRKQHSDCMVQVSN